MENKTLQIADEDKFTFELIAKYQKQKKQLFQNMKLYGEKNATPHNS